MRERPIREAVRYFRNNYPTLTPETKLTEEDIDAGLSSRMAGEMLKEDNKGTVSK